MDDDIAAQLRALWPTDDDPGQSNAVISRDQSPEDGECHAHAQRPRVKGFAEHLEGRIFIIAP